MDPNPGRTRVLNPFERFSEILFGLIMVLSFTCAISATEAGRKDLRTMFIAAVGCNLAWGIIDAVFYLIGCMAECSYNTKLLKKAQAADPESARRIISGALPPKVAAALGPGDLDRIHAHLKQEQTPGVPKLATKDWLGALGVFLLVFLSTFPVVIPFIFIHNVRLALHVSNAVAIVLLFAAADRLARYAGMPRLRTGFIMVAVGAALVAITISLGG